MEAANIKYDHVEKTYLRRYMSNKHKNKNGTCVTFLQGSLCLYMFVLYNWNYTHIHITPSPFPFFRFVKYYCEACFFYWN